MGVHIGIALGFTGIVGLMYVSGLKQGIMLAISTINGQITSYTLSVIPLFILMGLMAASGGLSTRLYDSLVIWFGSFKSGLGIATMLASAGFGTVCGSGIATAAAFSKISAPEMRKHGYSKWLSYGITSSGGAIGMLIPPSLLAVVYGVLSGLSIAKLLMGGVGAGILMTLFYCACIIVLDKIFPSAIPNYVYKKATWSQRIAALPAFWPIIVGSVIVIGGIFTGVFTPTECGAIAVFILAVFTFIINRAKEFIKFFYSSIAETVTMTCMIFLILAGAMVFSRFLVLTGITAKVTNYIINADVSPHVFIAMFLLLYLALGTIIESISMLSITIPTVNPIVEALGIDPIWFAVMVIAATQIGLTTPPMGAGVYAAKAVAEPDVSIQEIFKGAFPFIVTAAILFVILIAFPGIITYLPSFIYSK